jgi:hypothetical protein
VGNLPKALKMELAAFELALGNSFHNKVAHAQQKMRGLLPIESMGHS